MMKKVMTPLGVFAALAIGTGVAAQDPAALVVRVQGDVSVSHGGAAAAPATVGEPVFVGDVITPAQGARAILITRSGGNQVITEETTIAEPRTGGGGNPDVFARAMATLTQAASTDASLGGRQGMIRPLPGSRTALVSPRNELAVSSTRPTFVWLATPGARYDLQLVRVGGGAEPLIFELGTDTTFALPDDVPDLEHGAQYEWTVFPNGRRGGRPAANQRFRVITLIESVEMQDYLDEIAVFGLDPQGDGLFLTVVAYSDLELFYDAHDALAAVEADTALSPDLYMLKGEILATLGREEDARAAFDKADELMR